MYLPHKGPQEAFLSAKIIPEVLFGGARGGGKLLSLVEFLPTPNGYVQLKDLCVGDTLFDENGEPCTVLELHPINLSPVSYRVHFDDGSIVDACEEHLWLTYDKSERRSLQRRTEEFRANRRAKRPSRAKENPVNRGVQQSVTKLNKERIYEYVLPATGTVRTTKEILETLRVGKEINHAIPVAKPLVLPERELPIPPYVLGAWLGDGHRHGGQFTGIDPDIWDEIEKEGFTVTHSSYCAKRHNIVGLSRLLKANNLYLNKHIPMKYLRASREQRLALLQGLMDTDGTVTDSGCAEFCNTNKNIIDGVYDLICSLGWKAKIREGRSKLNGIDKGPKWKIQWTPSEIVFRLPRKAKKQRLAKGWTTRWRYVTKIERIEPIPMRCIKVSSPNSLFLVSRSFIPTHNTAGLLADFLQDVYEHRLAWQGVLFRRTYPELEEVIKQSFRFYPETGGTYKVGTRTWSWPGGATLKLRSLESADDATKYQGHEYCLSLGEEVATPYGPVAIEKLKVGDWVMTGSGFAKVTKTIPPVDKHCVKVEKSDGTSQVHPVDHEILCDSGWQSYSSLVGIASKDFQEKSLESCTLPSVNVLVRCVKPVPLESRLEARTSTLYYGLYRLSELSGHCTSGVLPQFEELFQGLQQEQLQRLQTQGSVPCSQASYDEQDVLTEKRIKPSFQSDYPFCSRLHDEQPLLGKDSALSVPPLQGDAEEPPLVCCDEGARGSIHKCKGPYISTYPHPYVEWELPMAWDNSLEACSISYVGVRTCVDIEVLGDNNYIAYQTGTINKQCWIGWDEVTNWPNPDAYQMLIGCLRSSIASASGKVPARIRASGNPGGVGHQWVKDRWQIGKYKDGFVPIYDKDSGMTRMYIPSRTRDNPSLTLNSPNYEQQLRAVGSAELVKAWLEGDWEVVLGAYFDEWDEKLHVISDIDMDDIPPHWKIYRAYDHGSYHPFCVLWYTVAGNEWGDVQPGTILVLREWWGGDDEGKGIKMSVADIAEGIMERESEFHRRVEAGPADTQIFEEDGGRPISEILSTRGAYFFKADKRRIPGWNQVRNRLATGLLKVSRCCRWTRLTLPALQHDRSRPEDIDTTGNDHAADCLRYACMAWPITPQSRNSIKKKLKGPGFADLVDAAEDVLRRNRL